MIRRKRAEPRGERGAMQVRQLIGMQANRQAERLRLGEYLRGLFHREGDALAERVDRIGETLGGDRRQHLVADRVDVAGLVAVAISAATAWAPRNVVRTDIGRSLAETACGLQLPALGIEFEAVAGLDLDGGDAFGDQGVEPRQRCRDELVGACLPRRLHGRDDAAAGARDFFVARAGETLLEFVGAIAAIDQMGMAVDQAGRDPAAGAIDPLLGIERGRRVRGGAGIDDAAIAGGDQAVIDQTEALARRRKRRKTAAVPDAVDEGHDGCGPSSLQGCLASPFICLYIL